MSPYVPVLYSEGGALVAACRQLCAEAVVKSGRARALREEIGVVIRLTRSAKAERAEAATQQTGLHRELGSRACAEDLIDDHGRWARHVAMTRAAERVCRDDAQGGAFWCAVLNTIHAIQSHQTA